MTVKIFGIKAIALLQIKSSSNAVLSQLKELRKEQKKQAKEEESLIDEEEDKTDSSKEEAQTSLTTTN